MSFLLILIKSCAFHLYKSFHSSKIKLFSSFSWKKKLFFSHTAFHSHHIIKLMSTEIALAALKAKMIPSSLIFDRWRIKEDLEEAAAVEKEIGIMVVVVEIKEVRRKKSNFLKMILRQADYPFIFILINNSIWFLPAHYFKNVTSKFFKSSQNIFKKLKR